LKATGNSYIVVEKSSAWKRENIVIKSTIASVTCDIPLLAKALVLAQQ
jgi:hypothetical protein